jgi:hypothetical protein
MELIILTVQSTGNGKWRLGVSLPDSRSYFKENGVLVIVILGTKKIYTRTTCGPPNNKGFDIYDVEINAWIIENGFNLYKPGAPTKMKFKFQLIAGRIHLTFGGLL